MKTKISEETINSIIVDYTNGGGLVDIATRYHLGKLKVKEILSNNNIPLRARGELQIKERNFVVSDWKIEKYPAGEGYHYVANAKDDSISFEDYNNKGGHLTSYIREKYGVETPTLYDRRIYYQTTGDYWWEQWFDIVKVENPKTKKCPYCGWETIDVENKSGVFEQHLRDKHNKTVEEYLIEYPSDSNYFSKIRKKKEKEEKLRDNNNFVTCPICHNRYEKMTASHILSHGLTVDEFKAKYPDFKMLSLNMLNQSREVVKLGNLSVSKNRFISKYEIEIRDFLKEHNVEFSSNRQILIGKEIDILIPDKKIGIEFNGLKWHTEWFGKKTRSYHLNKTIECNEKGYGLIQIFEDEYVNHKDIVYSKISHILGLDSSLPRIMGRKCIVKPIYKYDAEQFLNKYHIQGFASGTVYLGAFYREKLVAVMVFKNGSIKNYCWELTRFASDSHYRYQGVGSKLFSYFIKNYKPEKIISFADRRWTMNPEKNLYTNLGFSLDQCTPPDYRYYIDESKNSKKFERIHKMKMSKQILHRKYGLPLTMTETEMVKELGYDRIWDCGLIKYVWRDTENAPK